MLQIGTGGGKLDQEEREVAYKEAQTILYYKEKKRWLKQHPSYNSEDNFYLLSRKDLVIMVCLRTGQCRLRHHFHTTLHIGDTYMCPCSMAPMKVQHLLQDAATHQNERMATWPTEIPVKKKDLWPTGESAAHSDLRMMNRGYCLRSIECLYFCLCNFSVCIDEVNC